MDILRKELTYGLHDATQLAHATIRLTAAALLGAVIGSAKPCAWVRQCVD